MLRRAASGLLAVLLTMVAAPAHAALVTFTDKTVFLATTSATQATVAYSGCNPSCASFTSGSVTFGLGPSATQLIVDEWTAHLAGNDLAISGRENLDASLTGLVYSLGFDFVEPEFDPLVNAPFVDSTFQVFLRDGATAVGDFLFSVPNDQASFVGVQSSTAFDNVQIREIVGDDENEFFGQFYTGNVAAVPIPAAAWLFGSALAGLGALRLRRRRDEATR